MSTQSNSWMENYDGLYETRHFRIFCQNPNLIVFFIARIVSFHLFLRWIIVKSLTRIRGKVLASFWSLRVFFLSNNHRQQLWMKVTALLFHLSSLWHFFSSLSEACWHRLMSLTHQVLVASLLEYEIDSWLLFWEH